MAPGSGGPSLGDDDGGWLCREPAILLPSPPCLCLSRTKGPDQGAGSDTESRPPLSWGHVEIGDDARRWGQNQPSPLPGPPRPHTPNFGRGSLKAGVQAGRLSPPPMTVPCKHTLATWMRGCWGGTGPRPAGTDREGRCPRASWSGWRGSRGVFPPEREPHNRRVNVPAPRASGP